MNKTDYCYDHWDNGDLSDHQVIGLQGDCHQSKPIFFSSIIPLSAVCELCHLSRRNDSVSITFTANQTLLGMLLRRYFYAPPVVLLCPTRGTFIPHRWYFYTKTWYLYAPPVVLLCPTRGTFMPHPWYLYTPPVVLLCPTRGTFIPHPLYLYTPSVVLLCPTRGTLFPTRGTLFPTRGTFMLHPWYVYAPSVPDEVLKVKKDLCNQFETKCQF